MISDLDISRAANLVIKRHGPDAVIEAVRMVDRMLELGDLVAEYPARDLGAAGAGRWNSALNVS
jgi:hypothetical protein